MKKLPLFGITLMLLGYLLLTTSCLNDATNTERLGKDGGFRVQFLFQKDGVNVYRFFDGSSAHYFTTRGETISTQGGKHKYEENIVSISDSTVKY